ncbi:MAG: ribonuclease III [Candidatus Krumholzibacteria bacterium]|nr:ribonuclease III [Candidatus Krumholzibacteria bacterium]
MHRFFEEFKRIFRFGTSKKLKQFEELERKLGYRFTSREYTIEALTHRSILGELKTGEERITYERLEFLGDSVLALVTSGYLFRNFPDEDEGQLTKKKSLLVSKSVLAKKAEEMGIKEHVILSDNALRGGVAEQESVMTAVLEALIGAIYLDGGIDQARSFIEERILRDIDEIIEHRDNINYKSLLQECTQSRFRSYPNYKVQSTTGPEHDKIFLVEVRVGGSFVGRGRGKSKKDAEQMAAKEALNNMRKNH